MLFQPDSNIQVPWMVPQFRRGRATAGGGASGYASAVLADSPMGYWRLGEGSGTSVADASGNGFAGTYKTGYTLGQTGALAGDANTSVSLNGSSSDISLAAAGSFSGGASLTIEAWVKCGSQGSSYPMVFGFNMSNSSLHGLRVLLTPSGDNNRLYGEVFGNSGSGANYSATPAGFGSNGAWHHVVLVADSALGQLRITLDGSTTYSSSASWGTFSSTPEFSAGNRFDGSARAYWSGTIDEIAIYSGVLSSTRILAHYNAGI